MASEKSFNGVLAMSAIFGESVGTDPVKKRDELKKALYIRVIGCFGRVEV
jgi:hypothetical protein